MKATERQIGGSHYKEMAIQPSAFIHKNGIGFLEGCAIKYLCRWRDKNGAEDLQKAIHFIELLIEFEGGKAPTLSPQTPKVELHFVQLLGGSTACGTTNCKVSPVLATVTCKECLDAVERKLTVNPDPAQRREALEVMKKAIDACEPVGQFGTYVISDGRLREILAALPEIPPTSSFTFCSNCGVAMKLHGYVCGDTPLPAGPVMLNAEC